MKKTFTWFRQVAFVEGISYLVLLIIAMPLKYLANMPLAVTIVGGIHGVLFVAYLILSYLVKEEFKKSFGWVFKAFIASIIPFGTFYMDKEWKREQAEQINLS